MTPADWIGVATFVAAVVGAAVTAYWQSQRTSRGDDQVVGSTETRVLALTVDDRALLASLRDAMKAVSLLDGDRRVLFDMRDAAISLRDVVLSLGRRIDALTNEIADARRATEDNTAARRRD